MALPLSPGDEASVPPTQPRAAARHRFGTWKPLSCHRLAGDGAGSAPLQASVDLLVASTHVTDPAAAFLCIDLPNGKRLLEPMHSVGARIFRATLRYGS